MTKRMNAEMTLDGSRSDNSIKRDAEVAEKMRDWHRPAHHDLPRVIGLEPFKSRLSLNPSDVDESIAGAVLTVSETGGAIRTIVGRSIVTQRPYTRARNRAS